MYGNWSKKDITTRIELLNSLTIHTAKADWSNWPKTITITVDGETTTHKTLKAAYEVLFQTDRFYEDREPETTTTENKEEETMKFTVCSATYGPMRTFDNEHNAVSATNTYNWTTENDKAYIEKEETTMKTTNIKIDLTEGVAKFELNGITYKYNIESKRYAKTTPDGKTKRIGKAEYDEAKATYDNAWAAHEQEKLDKNPCRVEVENDLEKPAVLNENGLVDCSKCNCDRCVHRNCMRRNPRNVGGLGECPRLDNGIMGEGQKIAEEEGIEPAEAELEANIRAEQKKPRKARKSKDIAYEGHGKTLTAKQVDFILHLSDTCFWEHGLESTPWIDVLCDEIGGQFAGKPMTVGAMVSTLCEKGLGYRATDSLTDMVTGRSRKATYFALTDLGKEIAAELGLE